MAKYMINPDPTFAEIVETVRQGLRQNDGYCPCELVHNEDTKCVCKNMRENNYCKCGLFVPIKED